MAEKIRNIPVFVSPSELKFYLASKSTHKQLLTIVNPYEMPVKFKVMCTAPKKYKVVVPEGSIGASMLVDVVVRHMAPTESNADITDKFRISLLDHDTNQFMGKTDIEAKLLSGEADMSSKVELFKSLPNNTAVDGASLTYRPPEERPASNDYISIIAVIICLALLCLPTQQEVMPSSRIPEYLHLSSNFKLVVAYILGLATPGIFRFRAP